jgi:hypothetical protein
MSFAQQMIQSSPSQAMGGAALAECIRACFDCAQACTACADACLGEQDPRPLARCIRLNLDCADVCDATGRIVSRQTAFDAQMVRATLQACATACRLCGDECERHAAHMEHCRVCAEACRQCEKACDTLLGTLTM